MEEREREREREEEMIKVTKNLKFDFVKPYPKLMIGVTNDCIVLFTSKNTGTVLHCGSKGTLTLGQHIQNWGSDQFVDYAGPITLENE